MGWTKKGKEAMSAYMMEYTVKSNLKQIHKLERRTLSRAHTSVQAAELSVNRRRVIIGHVCPVSRTQP